MAKSCCHRIQMGIRYPILTAFGSANHMFNEYFYFPESVIVFGSLDKLKDFVSKSNECVIYLESVILKVLLIVIH